MAARTLDNSTRASNPGEVKLSHTKLRRFHPELYSRVRWVLFLFSDTHEVYPRRKYWLTNIEEHLSFGDTRAAVVISISPVLVAAYTDELDCVALLQFEDRIAEEYSLQAGTRLLTINTYFTGAYAKDLQPGPNASGRYGNFTPLIAEFLTDDVAKVELRKSMIVEAEWLRTMDLGSVCLAKHGLRARDGHPLFCASPAEIAGSKKASKDSVTHFSVGELIKSILILLAFLVFTALCVYTIRVDRETGWVGTILFGTMSVLTVVGIVQICRADKVERQQSSIAAGVKQHIRSSLIWVGTIAISIFLGLADHFIARTTSIFSHWLGVWLGTFLTTLAFYPLRGEEQKENFPTFFWWSVYCAVMALLSIGIYFLNRASFVF